MHSPHAEAMSSQQDAIVIDDDDDGVGTPQPASLQTVIPDRAQLERERLARVRARQAAQGSTEARAAPRAHTPTTPSARHAPAVPNLPTPPSSQSTAGPSSPSVQDRKRRASQDPPLTWSAYTPKRRTTSAQPARKPKPSAPSPVAQRHATSASAPQPNAPSGRYTPIRSTDRFWRGAIKVGRQAHTGDLQSLCSQHTLWYSSRGCAPPCNTVAAQRTAPCTTHVVRRGDRLAPVALSPCPSDIHRQSAAWRCTARSKYPPTRLLPVQRRIQLGDGRACQAPPWCAAAQQAPPPILCDARPSSHLYWQSVAGGLVAVRKCRSAHSPRCSTCKTFPRTPQSQQANARLASSSARSWSGCCTHSACRVRIPYLKDYKPTRLSAPQHTSSQVGRCPKSRVGARSPVRVLDACTMLCVR